MKTVETSNWLYTLPQRWNLIGVGKTREDALEAFDAAKDSGQVSLKTLGSEVGPAISLTERWVVRTQEFVSKTVGTILPLVAGLSFLNEAASLFSGPEYAQDPVMGLVMGVIGATTIAVAPTAAWRFGQAYNKIYHWMKDNDLSRAHVVRPSWHN